MEKKNISLSFLRESSIAENNFNVHIFKLLKIEVVLPRATYSPLATGKNSDLLWVAEEVGIDLRGATDGDCTQIGWLWYRTSASIDPLCFSVQSFMAVSCVVSFRPNRTWKKRLEDTRAYTACVVTLLCSILLRDSRKHSSHDSVDNPSILPPFPLVMTIVCWAGYVAVRVAAICTEKKIS